MIKKSIMYVSIICLSILIVGSLVNIDLILDYLYPEVHEVISLDDYQDSQEEIEGEGIRAIYNEEKELEELQIVDKQYSLGPIRVGDPIDKVYAEYDEEEIKVFDHYIEVVDGEEENYGIRTEYTQYIMDSKKHIQEIRTGYTAPFVTTRLMENNTEVKERLEGVWVSDTGRILEFGDMAISDSYLDDFWDIQTYHLVSPNELLIKRLDGEYSEQITMNIWLDEEYLYIFSVDKNQVPILETTEAFVKAEK